MHTFSDGVGRTGALISIHAEMERMKAETVVDLFQFIKGMRTQRAGMVSSKVLKQLLQVTSEPYAGPWLGGGGGHLNQICCNHDTWHRPFFVEGLSFSWRFNHVGMFCFGALKSLLWFADRSPRGGSRLSRPEGVSSLSA